MLLIYQNTQFYHKDFRTKRAILKTCIKTSITHQITRRSQFRYQKTQLGRKVTDTIILRVTKINNNFNRFN